MRRYPLIACVLTAAGVAVASAGASPVAAGEEVLTPEQREQPTPLQLTVYADGWGQVWDRRSATFAAGLNRLAFEGVSREMLPSSAIVGGGEGMRLVDVNYDLDLLSFDALLRRSVGKPVGVVRLHPTSGDRLVETGVLLSIEGGPLVRHADRVEQVDPARITIAEVPPELRPRPTLLLSLHSPTAGRQSLALGYLTRGLGWSADDVAQWDDAAGRVQLTGRATLSNTTGTDFPDAELSLIAGTINREEDMRPTPRMPMARAQAAPMVAEAKSMPMRQEFADLHLYRLPGRVNLVDRQTKQVTMLALPSLPVTHEYVSENDLVPFRQGGEPQPTHPQVRLSFTNPAGKNGGGTAPEIGSEPLPAGLVRVYLTSAGSLPRLVGEDRIGHTPTGGKVTLSPGQAFDLTVLRRQTDFVRKGGASDGASETAWAIEVRNARDKPAEVKVVETIPGDWNLLAESQKHEKETSDRAAWRLTVPARGTAQLTYRVLVQQ